MPHRPTGSIPRNVAASIHQRVLNLAYARGRPFNEVVQYYAMERVLARIVHAGATERFVLKGALALRTLEPSAARATRDIDLLALAPNVDLVAPTTQPDSTLNTSTFVTTTLHTCLDFSLPSDGVVFDMGSLVTTPITAQTDDAGVRVLFRGTLGTVRLAMQIDVGFGDVTEPAPHWVEYPQLLESTPLRVLAYRRETIVAEKFHAIVARGSATSRFKDFHDLWLMRQSGHTDAALLRQAILATFARRATSTPVVVPIVLTPAFASEPGPTAQWETFWRKSGLPGTAPLLATVVRDIAAWLMPFCDAAPGSTAGKQEAQLSL